MSAYEIRRRRLLLTGGAIVGLTVYLLLIFTALLGRDFMAGAEGAYASAGDPGVIALGAVDEALRMGPDAPPPPRALSASLELRPTWPGIELDDAVFCPTARTPLEDRQVLRL